MNMLRVHKKGKYTTEEEREKRKVRDEMAER